MKNISDVAIRPTWIEIDLDAVTNNVNEWKRILGEKILITAAIKGSGIGHGLVPVAKHLISMGISYFFMGNIYEAIKLRKEGIKSNIALFGNTLPEAAKYYADYNLMPSFTDRNDPKDYMKVLGKNTPLKIWIKVETGLGRFGVDIDQVIDMVKEIQESTPYKIEGIYSHIGGRAQKSSVESDAYCENQWQIFKKLKEDIESLGINIPYYEIASTYPIVVMPHTWMNCVCIGTGFFKNEGMDKPKLEINIKPAFHALKSKLVSLNKHKAGDQIGGYLLERDSLIGVIPIGLADGLSGKNKDKEVLVNGVRCPIRGGVSFEHTRVDVTDSPGVQKGDEVVIIGKQGNDEITPEEVCKRTGQSWYQLVSSFNPMFVPHIYLKNGEVWDTEIAY